MCVICSFFITLVEYFLKCVMLIFFGLKGTTFIPAVQDPKICLVYFMDLKCCPSSLGSHQTQVIDVGRTPKMPFPKFPPHHPENTFYHFCFPSILAIIFSSDIFSLVCSWVKLLPSFIYRSLVKPNF